MDTLIWVSNIPEDEKHKFPNHIIDRPQATEYYTVEQLEKGGLCGLYTVAKTLSTLTAAAGAGGPVPESERE